MAAREVPFTELLSHIVDNRGRTCPVSDSGMPLIATNCVRNDLLYPAYDKVRYVSEDTYASWFRGHPEPGDLIFVCKGSPGRVCLTPDPVGFCIAQDMVAVRADPTKVYPRFLFAALRLDVVQQRIANMHVGTLIPHFKKGDFDKLLVPLPDYGTQIGIGDLYFTLSAKIDLNRRMNATLEAMSRAIFKSWFVDFDPVRQKAAGKQPVGMDAKTASLFPDSFEDSEIGEVPKGWRTCVLDDFIADVIGGDWGESEPTDLATTPCRCVRGADIPSLQEGGIGKMPLRYLKPSSVGKRQLNAGDIAVEISGGSPTQSTGRPVLVTAGLLNRLDHALVASNFCRIVKLQHPSASQFLYLYLRHLYDEDTFLQYENGTTGIKNFAYTLFASRHPLLAPDDRVIDAFASKTTSLSESAQHKAKESEVLAALRDTLLPKLLSGELRIPEAEQAVEEATA